MTTDAEAKSPVDSESDRCWPNATGKHGQPVKQAWPGTRPFQDWALVAAQPPFSPACVTTMAFSQR